MARLVILLIVLSVRKFKEKIKEWNCEKYLGAEESRFVTAKRKTRAEEGKGTTFYKNGKKIDEKRIEKSYKRKWENVDDPGPFTAGKCTETQGCGGSSPESD